MLANFLIGLREGLEASLVVGILVAYLVKTGRGERVKAVWTGVAAAIALSLGIGGALTLTATELPDRAEPTFAGLMSLGAVVLVTWMIFWMRRAARSMASELHGRVEKAVAMGAGALVLTAFFAVAREGLETALFMWSAVQSSGSGSNPLLGGTLGLLLAAALGWLLYRRAVRINLARFFTWTGAGLVIVAAGVLAYGIHDLQEAGWVPGSGVLAFDVSGTIAPSSLLATVIRGIFNLSPSMTWLEVVVWVGYLVPVLYLFLRKDRTTRATLAAVVAEASPQSWTTQSPITERSTTGSSTTDPSTTGPSVAPSTAGSPTHR